MTGLQPQTAHHTSQVWAETASTSTQGLAVHKAKADAFETIHLLTEAIAIQHRGIIII